MKQDILKLLRIRPGLKGREIAKELGIDKSEVNSFLSKNREVFRQDSDFCWHVASISQIEIEFPTGWIDSHTFERTFADYDNIFELKSAIKFVIPSDCKLLIYPIAKLLALSNQLAIDNIPVTIDMRGCSDTRSFLNRVGFFDQLHHGINVLPSRPLISMAETYKGNSTATVEFGSIDPNSINKPLIKQLGNAFVSKSDDRFTTAARTVFSELIGNVSEHSKSPISGFAALQCYSPPHKQKHIQTVVSDNGLGISATLRPSLKNNYPKLYAKFMIDNLESDIGIVTEVVSKGNISRYGGARGLGFKSSREQASRFNADLSIRQEHFCVELTYRNGLLDNSQVLRNLTRIPGTHICFDFLVD